MKTPEEWSREIYDKYHSLVMGRASVKPAVSGSMLMAATEHAEAARLLLDSANASVDARRDKTPNQSDG